MTLDKPGYSRVSFQEYMFCQTSLKISFYYTYFDKKMHSLNLSFFFSNIVKVIIMYT